MNDERLEEAIWCSDLVDDSLAEDINHDLTFAGFLEALEDGADIYDVMGVGDSLLREKVFSALSEITGHDYDYFYDMWLAGGKVDDERLGELIWCSDMIQDSLAEDIDHDLTFGMVLEGLEAGEDIYEMMGVGDSVLREKVFGALSEITGYDYDYFYNLWLRNG